jgi:ADP-ribose pyrophosphatase
MTTLPEDHAAEIASGEPEILCDGFKRMLRYRVRHRLQGQDWSNIQTRDLHEGGHVVAVMAHDPKRDVLILIRQFRLAAQLATGKGHLVEVVAGAVDPGEDAQTAARRELHEETGLTALSLRHLFDFMPSPGITTERASVYLATVDASNLPDRAGHDEGEETRPFAIRFDDALAMLDQGKIGNAFLQLSLLHLARHGLTAGDQT